MPHDSMRRRIAELASMPEYRDSPRSKLRKAVKAERMRRPVDPIQAAEQRIDEAAERRARSRPPRDPLKTMNLSSQQEDAGYWYRDAYWAVRSSAVSNLIDRTGGGEMIAPQEIARQHLERWRVCEAAVPSLFRYRWLDPIVIEATSPTTWAQRLGVDKNAVGTMIKQLLDVVHGAYVEYERGLRKRA
jgi:hypothetical protein